MFNLNIIESKDPDFIGSFEIRKNSFSVGSGNNDIKFKSNDIIPNHLAIEIKDNKIFINPNSNIECFWVNGKRTTSTTIVLINDIIEIEGFKFKITNFLFQEEYKINKTINNYTEKIIKENHEVLNLLKNLNE